MYEVGKHPLCLSCFATWQQSNAAIQQASNERQAQLMAYQNYLSEMMAWQVGLRATAPQIQIPQPIHAHVTQRPTLNYIQIDHSVIGMLNTGSIQDVQRIDVNIESLSQSGNSEIAAGLKHLTEAIASNQELSDAQRTDFLDQLNLISSQATLPADQRKLGIIRPVLTGLATGVNAVSSLASVWALTGDLICAYFGIENPFDTGS